MSFFIVGQNVRKKIIENILAYFTEISKNIELKMTSYNKTCSKAHYPEVGVINFNFITKIYDFIRKLFDFKIEKAEEILKFIKYIPI